MNPQKFTPQQALPKAKHYCAYQERCHSEVKEKLYGFGLNTKEVDQIVSTLIEENYLNEERFAIQFAGGHFRSKKWGRVKISYALKQKRISPYCIKKALKQIDEEEYAKTLQKLFEEKLRTLKSEKNSFIKKRKLQDNLMQKGYETELIRELLAEI
ncbi:regulatory protein RecX [Ferruginibacter sp. SUN106]|uniref:regulatory protein RecX n=1 Tax=Ferruginibacter sp. SUN106 TaxID=2978348 RepID=UPI003D35CDCB